MNDGTHRHASTTRPRRLTILCLACLPYLSTARPVSTLADSLPSSHSYNSLPAVAAWVPVQQPRLPSPVRGFHSSRSVPSMSDLGGHADDQPLRNAGGSRSATDLTSIFDAAPERNPFLTRNPFDNDDDADEAADASIAPHPFYSLALSADGLSASLDDNTELPGGFGWLDDDNDDEAAVNYGDLPSPVFSQPGSFPFPGGDQNFDFGIDDADDGKLSGKLDGRIFSPRVRPLNSRRQKEQRESEWLTKWTTGVATYEVDDEEQDRLFTQLAEHITDSAGSMLAESEKFLRTPAAALPSNANAVKMVTNLRNMINQFLYYQAIFDRIVLHKAIVHVDWWQLHMNLPSVSLYLGSVSLARKLTELVKHWQENGGDEQLVALRHMIKDAVEAKIAQANIDPPNRSFEGALEADAEVDESDDDDDAGEEMDNLNDGRLLRPYVKARSLRLTGRALKKTAATDELNAALYNLGDAAKHIAIDKAITRPDTTVTEVAAGVISFVESLDKNGADVARKIKESGVLVVLTGVKLIAALLHQATHPHAAIMSLIVELSDALGVAEGVMGKSVDQSAESPTETADNSNVDDRNGADARNAADGDDEESDGEVGWDLDA